MRLLTGRYLEFMQTLYGDRFATLTQEDSKRAFDDYIADARKRFEHDEQFPDEPKQVLPGENVEMKDGKFQVSGQVSVMAVKQKNASHAFGEESRRFVCDGRIVPVQVHVRQCNSARPDYGTGRAR